MITTQELAVLAGVSQSTVSRSLNNSPHISEETRNRIQSLAKEHGYIVKKRQPHSKENGKKGGIGIVLNANAFRRSLDLYLQYLLSEIIKQVEDKGYYSIVLTDNMEDKAVERVESVIKTKVLCGVVIINTDYNGRLEEQLNHYDIPHVYTQYFSRPLQKSMNIIDVDHFTGGVLATRHLISLGHRKIGTFTSYGSDFEDRTSGYKAALQNNGIAFDAKRVVHSRPGYVYGYEAIRDNWEALSDCTAFFAQTDLMGIGILSYLIDSGHRVPEEYSVIGFDGINEGQYCRPQLSTVFQPIAEIASLSIQRLVSLIDREDSKATHSFVQPILQIRDSTAALPIRQEE